jgi:hypothetical protein
MLGVSRPLMVNAKIARKRVPTTNEIDPAINGEFTIRLKSVLIGLWFDNKKPAINAINININTTTTLEQPSIKPLKQLKTKAANDSGRLNVSCLRELLNGLLNLTTIIDCIVHL